MQNRYIGLMPHSPLPQVFGRRLRFLRTMAGMTQARLAEDSGISVDHLSKIERGLSCPSFPVIARLAEVMGVSPSSLFGDGAPRADLEAPDGARTYLRELNHRVRNSFAILSSLADLAAMDATGQEARDKCRNISAKVRHMATLHDMLSARNLDDTMDVVVYLQRIFHQLADLHPRSRLLLHLRADEVRLSARKALPFGLAVFELLINTFKHAYTADTVRVTVSDDGRDTITVIVADNGPGLPSFMTRSRCGKGLGLVRTLVEDQLGGSLELRSNAGAEARMSFRITD